MMIDDVMTEAASVMVAITTTMIADAITTAATAATATTRTADMATEAANGTKDNQALSQIPNNAPHNVTAHQEHRGNLSSSDITLS